MSVRHAIVVVVAVIVEPRALAGGKLRFDVLELRNRGSLEVEQACVVGVIWVGGSSAMETHNATRRQRVERAQGCPKQAEMA